MDQAQSLRHLAAIRRSRAPQVPPPAPLRTLAVTSGKGGVGKTNIVVNLAMALSRLGRKVLIIDADLGLANVDVVLGLNPAYTIRDVLSGEKRLLEVLLPGPGGIRILPAASGVSEMSNLSSDDKLLLLQELESLPNQLDTVIVDTSAGISDTVLYFNLAVQERLVIATGEPTSLTDAYALIKVLYTQHQERRFKIIVNNVANQNEAKKVYRKLAMAVDHFLGGISLDYLGFVPTDPHVSQAVMRQKPFLEAFPTAPSSLAVQNLAKAFMASPVEEVGGNIKFFWRRLVKMA